MMEETTTTLKPFNPTVGRHVYYKEYGAPNTKERAAVITDVHADEVVDLAVLTPDGALFIKGVNRGDREGQWEAMPIYR